MDYNKLCLGCFRENKTGSDVCPSCGFNEKEYNRKAAEKMCLPAGTILQGKYLIGKLFPSYCTVCNLSFKMEHTRGLSYF